MIRAQGVDDKPQNFWWCFFFALRDPGLVKEYQEATSWDAKPMHSFRFLCLFPPIYAFRRDLDAEGCEKSFYVILCLLLCSAGKDYALHPCHAVFCMCRHVGFGGQTGLPICMLAVFSIVLLA